jgi:hypothetical protein
MHLQTINFNLEQAAIINFYELTMVTAPFTTKQEMENNYFVLKINVG